MIQNFKRVFNTLFLNLFRFEKVRAARDKQFIILIHSAEF